MKIAKSIEDTMVFGRTGGRTLHFKWMDRVQSAKWWGRVSYCVAWRGAQEVFEVGVEEVDYPSDGDGFEDALPNPGGGGILPGRINHNAARTRERRPFIYWPGLAGGLNYIQFFSDLFHLLGQQPMHEYL